MSAGVKASVAIFARGRCIAYSVWFRLGRDAFGGGVAINVF